MGLQKARESRWVRGSLLPILSIAGETASRAAVSRPLTALPAKVYNTIHGHSRQDAAGAAADPGAVPQRGRAATGGPVGSARAADRPRRALLLSPHLSRPDRPARGRSTGRGPAAKRPRHGQRHRDARHRQRRLRAGCVGPHGDRPPSRPLVQPAVHARPVRSRPAGAGFGQTAAQRPGLGNAPSTRRNPGRRRRRAGGQNPARLSLDRRLAAVADAADRPRGVGLTRGFLGRGFSGGLSASAQPSAARRGAAAGPFSERPGGACPCPAKAGLPGVVPFAACVGGEAASATAAAEGHAAGGDGPDRRPHPKAVSVRVDRRRSSRPSRRSRPTWPGRCR